MTGRDRALLRAVAAGRAELVCGREPHLLIDGRHVCDQDSAVLTHAGLITPAVAGRVGVRVPAALTGAGRDALAGEHRRPVGHGAGPVRGAES